MAAPKGRPGKRTGRPTKLTPEVARLICNAIRAGCFPETAIEAAGVSRATLYGWLRKGKTEKRGVHRDFLDTYKRALAEFEVSVVATMRRIGDKKNAWMALAWLLERRMPQRWARPEVKAEYFDDKEDRGPRRVGMPFAPPQAKVPPERA